MVTHGFYFMLCQSSLLNTVISFVYKDKWWFDEKHVSPGDFNSWESPQILPALVIGLFE